MLQAGTRIVGDTALAPTALLSANGELEVNLDNSSVTAAPDGALTISFDPVALSVISTTLTSSKYTPSALIFVYNVTRAVTVWRLNANFSDLICQFLNVMQTAAHRL